MTNPKIMVDKNVDMKKLKRITSQSNLEWEIFQANIENITKRIEQKPALAILGVAKLPMRLENKTTNNFEKIKSIIGNDKVADALQVNEADYHNAKYLITEDNDILSKREELKLILTNLKIVNINEFETLLLRGKEG